MTVVRSIIGVIVGIIVGGILNSAIVSISGDVIPLPEGVNPQDMESLKANMHLFEPKNFIMPFLAHALGTLVGAFIAAKIAIRGKMVMGLIVGGFFQVGGIMVAYMLPAPVWFNVLDLVVAYFPMGFLGYWLSEQIGAKSE